jgi:hypothetical protein
MIDPLDKIGKNASVLLEQVHDTRIAIALDVARAGRKWDEKDYLGAAHSIIFGVPAEITQHMHRWVFYGFLTWGAVELWQYLSSMGLF